MSNTCPERKDGTDHCWHMYNTPIPNPASGAMMFPSVCCYCAPGWMHIDVLLPSQVSDEAMTAEQMKHGHLVTLKRAPKQQRGPSLMVPRG